MQQMKHSNKMFDTWVNSKHRHTKDSKNFTGKQVFKKKGLIISNRLLRRPACLKKRLKYEPIYKLLVVSKQEVSTEAGRGQPAPWVLTARSPVCDESEGCTLWSHSDVELIIAMAICDSSCFATRLGEEMGRSGEESLARSCKWSRSELYSMLTVLYRPHRFCCIFVRFSCNSFCSWSRRSFSCFCGESDRKITHFTAAHLFGAHLKFKWLYILHDIKQFNHNCFFVFFGEL